ncbi:hypothetical protein BV898_09721 [Hypsibius exemplaris]|uniref:Uncharacterized protein n=1 Tax=Hypsibius exemplaris TaxID=2072580 RepID=A0A1W0WLK8_HYPEX|nr:hypothetical protein BV898_09721 [Hypsibius exemplaris]
MLQFVILLAFLVFTQFAAVAYSAPLTCPPGSEVLPCTCTSSATEKPSLACIGPTISQANIERLFARIRAVNAIPLDGGPEDSGEYTPSPSDKKLNWINITRFDLINTEMTSLNNAPLVGCHFDVLDASNNSLLREIVLADINKLINGRYRGEISVAAETVRFDRCALGDSAWKAFTMFHNSVRHLSLKNNALAIVEYRSDYLKQLHALERLDLADNRIYEIRGSQFTENHYLQHLNLSRNRISSLGPAAFKILHTPFELADKRLTIDLSHNNLYNGQAVVSDPYRVHRPIDLILAHNNYISVGTSNFLELLLADRTNTIDFTGNNWICSREMSWLKSAAVVFADRVKGLDCINDPGKTAFTSSFT